MAFGIIENGLATFELKNINNAFFVYKCVCADIDGRNEGLEPFAGRANVEGKIIAGKRAQEWLNKSIQEKN